MQNLTLTAHLHIETVTIKSSHIYIICYILLQFGHAFSFTLLVLHITDFYISIEISATETKLLCQYFERLHINWYKIVIYLTFFCTLFSRSYVQYVLLSTRVRIVSNNKKIRVINLRCISRFNWKPRTHFALIPALPISITAAFALLIHKIRCWYGVKYNVAVCLTYALWYINSAKFWRFLRVSSLSPYFIEGKTLFRTRKQLLFALLLKPQLDRALMSVYCWRDW